MINKRIGFIGCGNMGSTMVKGILKQKLFTRNNVYLCDQDKQKLAALKEETGVTVLCPVAALVKKADIIVLAVKPKDFAAVLRHSAGQVAAKKVVITIAAGISTEHIESILGRVPVVRVMPNLAVVVASGMSALSAGKYATPAHLVLGERIFSSIGKTIVVPERLLNAVTAVSGSGPAYIFEVMEDMISAAVKAGLPQDVSEVLVKQTVLGAAKLAIESSEDPGLLKKRVTSPGGTTEAALSYLHKHNFAQVLIEAIQRAKQRAQELTAC